MTSAFHLHRVTIGHGKAQKLALTLLAESSLAKTPNWAVLVLVDVDSLVEIDDLEKVMTSIRSERRCTFCTSFIIDRNFAVGSTTFALGERMIDGHTPRSGGQELPRYAPLHRSLDRSAQGSHLPYQEK